MPETCRAPGKNRLECLLFDQNHAAIKAKTAFTGSM
jgi:hypothetical protein